MPTIDLIGTWQLEDDSGEHRLEAAVPGTVHHALLSAERIPDPFVRRNEREVQWIGEREWIFAREFEVSEAVATAKRCELVCDGLDTLAEISINGEVLADADNMHRRWRFDLAGMLTPGRNHISVRFRSVLPMLKARQLQRPLRGPSRMAHEPEGRSYVRKEHSNFGWDWGICLITCGIYRDIRIEAGDPRRLGSPLIRQSHRGKKVKLEISAPVVGTRGEQNLRFALLRQGKLITDHHLRAGRGAAKATLTVDQPELWWPAGMGRQPLYEVVVELLDEAGEVVDRQYRRIGLRSVELRRKDDRWGQSFTFAVNGRPFFAKGANWIPSDAIKDRTRPEDYRRLLQDAADANMNMIRVWGGGYYEHDAFYETCDEVGLLVWHDLMFACAAYPADEVAFRASVEEEVRDQVRRLRHHACMAVWCGNNELEMGWARSDSDWPNMPMRWYRKLFDQEIPKILVSEDPDRAYWPSSPHTPQGERDDFNNPDSGDAHLWAVWHGRQPFEWYRGSYHRFCSEFGFQSFPEPKTVRGYTEPEDRYLNSPVMEWHQRSAIGNSRIMEYLISWFPMPHGFDHTLWMSQMVQSMAITYAVEHWRRNMPRCMGALYWQLNDNWPVASWSSIDYHGNWKGLHYAARRFFAPVLLSAVADEERQRIDVFITDESDEIGELELRWSMVTPGGHRVAAGRQEIARPRAGSRRADRIECHQALKYFGREDLIWFGELRDGRKVLSRNWVGFVPPKSLALVDPQLTWKAEVATDHVRVEIRAAEPALFVFLSHDQHQFVADDNMFALAPREKRRLKLLPRGCTPKQLAKGLRLRSLYDLMERVED